MAEITRRLEFDAAHRVLGHESKCANLHGHRYVAEITVNAPNLDSLGRVIDFSVIKELVGGWIDEHWDHNILLNREDPLAKIFWSEGSSSPIFGGKKPYTMPSYCGNPTAECIAECLFRTAENLLRKYGITVKRVRIYETPNCWADFPDEVPS